MSATTSPAAPGALARFFDGDVWHSFKSSPMAIVAALIAALCVFCSGLENLASVLEDFCSGVAVRPVSVDSDRGRCLGKQVFLDTLAHSRKQTELSAFRGVQQPGSR